jgi:hypothetical protein
MYNRGINSCSIFQNEQNQLFFLSKLSHYLNEICVYTIVQCSIISFFSQNRHDYKRVGQIPLQMCSVNEWIN